MDIIQSPKEISIKCKSLRDFGKIIGFVPTMGCLHDGHRSLIKKAKETCDTVVVSIFVNPLQFGKNEDFGSYPRPLDTDISTCNDLGVDLVFHPRNSDLYPNGFSTRVDSGAIGKKYCGHSRPGFFDGVLTVVNILFNIVRPQFAFFGEKDFQQLFLIRQLVRDFHMSTQIIGLPIIREESGLAMSSRNEYLNSEQRSDALCISRAIAAAQFAYQSGDKNVSSLGRLVRNLIAEVPSFTLDYAYFVDETSLDEVNDQIINPTRLLMAGYIGDNPRVRLIDNGRVN